MHRPNDHHRPPTAVHRGPRPGYTLMEMLLVLAVLLVLATIAWPAVLHIHGEYRLKDSAEEVRTRLAAARIHAIDTGTVYVFRYEPGGRRWMLAPWELDVEADLTATGEPLQREEEGELPDGLRFELVEGATGAVPAGSMDVAGMGQWGPPVLFYPDGSSLDAAFDVFDARGRSIRLAVRELTGAAQTSSVQREAGR